MSLSDNIFDRCSSTIKEGGLKKITGAHIYIMELVYRDLIREEGCNVIIESII